MLDARLSLLMERAKLTLSPEPGSTSQLAAWGRVDGVGWDTGLEHRDTRWA